MTYQKIKKSISGLHIIVPKARIGARFRGSWWFLNFPLLFSCNGPDRLKWCTDEVISQIAHLFEFLWLHDGNQAIWFIHDHSRNNAFRHLIEIGRLSNHDETMYLTKKNSSFARFARAFIIFVHFAHVLVLSTTWIALFCSYVNDDNTWCQIFSFLLSSPNRWYRKKEKKEFKNSKNTFCDPNDLEYMRNDCRNAVILSDKVLVVVDFVLTVTLSLPRSSPLMSKIVWR